MPWGGPSPRFASERVCRLRTEGGGQLLDLLGQARDAGGSWVIVVALPLMPRETVDALANARELGLRAQVICEPNPHRALAEVAEVAEVADEMLTAPISTRLTFDSHAAAMTLGSVILHAITEAGPERFDRRLEDFDSHAARPQLFLAQELRSASPVTSTLATGELFSGTSARLNYVIQPLVLAMTSGCGSPR